MSIYLSTTYARDGLPATMVLDEMIEHGISNVELGSTHSHEESFTSKLKNYEMRFLVHNYFPPPKERFVVNIASLDDRVRTKSLEHILQSISFCKEIGAVLYTFHPGFLTDPDESLNASNSYDFKFRERTSSERAYEEGFRCFLKAVQEITVHAKREKVPVAVESQGSMTYHRYLFLQRIEEFDRVFSIVGEAALGVNLNLGHLNLASRALKFDRQEFVDRIARRVVAIEISHNEGEHDDHRPLSKGEWYWNVIRDPRFNCIPVIFEPRNVSIETAVQMVRLLEGARAYKPPLRTE